MDTATLTSQLVDFIRDEIAFDADDLSSDTDLLLTGYVDSLGVIQIVDWLETALELTIDPVDVTLENFQTIDKMVAYTAGKLAAAA